MRGPYVYIVCSGERGEGHDPRSVHTTLRGAKKAVTDTLPAVAFNRGAADCWMATQNLVDEWWIFRKRVTP